jgi:hypothetical protein
VGLAWTYHLTRMAGKRNAKGRCTWTGRVTACRRIFKTGNRGLRRGRGRRGSSRVVCSGPFLQGELGPLDILFLRRDPPGSPIITGGDIDNRLKVLLDGLKMPKDCSQLPANWRPGLDQNPLYCLMEDDNLITEIKVTSDRLLIPATEDEHRNSVELVIHVTTKIVEPFIMSVGGAPQL